MRPTTIHLLALFQASLNNPTTRNGYLDEVGKPKDITRFAEQRDDDGALGFITDTVDGPQRDGAVETLSISLLSDSAMLVVKQVNTDKVGEPTDDEIDQMAQGYAAYLHKDRDIQLSAKGDSELDGKTTVYFLAQADTDSPYTAVDVGQKLQDVIVAGDMAFVYTEGRGALIPKDQLLQNLVDERMITDGAIKVVPLGLDKKLARGPKIVVGGQKVSTWAYVMKEPDGTFKMVVLDKDTLVELRSIPFDGKFATADREGEEIIIILHLVVDVDTRADQPDAGEQLDDANLVDTDADGKNTVVPNEQFRLTRVSTEQFTGDQATQ